MTVRLLRRNDLPDIRSLSELPTNAYWKAIGPHLRREVDRHGFERELYLPAKTETGEEIPTRLKNFLLDGFGLRILLLTGVHGVGKTSALHHFSTIVLPALPRGDQVWWIRADFGSYAESINRGELALPRAVVKVTSGHLATIRAEIGASHIDFVREAYQHDPFFADERDLRPTPGERALEKTWLKLETQPLAHAAIQLRYILRKKPGSVVLLAFDNLDELLAEFQLEAFSVAQALAVDGGVRAMLTLRDETAANLELHDSRVAGQYDSFQVQPPPLDSFLRLRLTRALSQENLPPITLSLGHANLQPVSLDSLIAALVETVSHDRVAELLRSLSNGSLRDVQDYAKAIFASHFVDDRPIAGTALKEEIRLPREPWRRGLPYHVVLRALLLANQRVYLPNKAFIPNLFGTRRSGTHIGPLLQLLLLRHLEKHGPRNRDDLAKEVAGVLNLTEETVLHEMDVARKARLVEALSRRDWAATTKGKYLANVLAMDDTYLAHIAVDVDMPEPSASSLQAPAEAISPRIENLAVVARYLASSELRVFVEVKRNGKIWESYRELFGSVAYSRSLYHCLTRALDGLEAQKSYGKVRYPRPAQKLREVIRFIESNFT